MIDDEGLAASFAALTCKPGPFRWQRRLLRRLVDNDLPQVVDIPTGLGKTHVMALLNTGPCSCAIYAVP